MTDSIKKLTALQQIDSFLEKPEMKAPVIKSFGGRSFVTSEGTFKLKELVFQDKEVVAKLKSDSKDHALSNEEKKLLKSIHTRLTEVDKFKGKYVSSGLHKTIQRLLTSIRQILGNTFGFNKQKALNKLKVDFSA